MKTNTTWKNGWRRLLCLLLCSITLISLLPAITLSAEAAGTKLGTPKNLTWNKTLEYTWNPDTEIYDATPVTQYGSYTFTPTEPIVSENAVYQIRLYKNGKLVLTDTEYDYYNTQREVLCSDFRYEDLGSGEYYFTVQALAGDSGYSDSDIAKSQTWTYTKPSSKRSKPTGLTRSGRSISWNSVGSSSTLYDVEFIHTPTKGDMSNVPKHMHYGISGTSYTLDDYIRDYYGPGYYYFRVRTRSDNIKTKYHSNWTEYVGPYYFGMDEPTIKATNVSSSGKIKLTWDAVDYAVKYQVYRATSKNGTYKLMKTTTSTSYTNTSAEAGKTYYYKVRAVSEKGFKSSYSNIVTRTCDLERPDVSITRSSKGNPKLTWDAVDGAVEYKVYRATSKNGDYKLMKTTTKTSYTNTSATAGKTYYYKVKAIASKSAANSAYSSVDSIKAK